MDDTLFWLVELRSLIKNLEKCWEGSDLSIAENVPREDPIVSTFVYGFPTFSGKRDGYRVSVTVEYFHHATTSLMKRNDHSEMLCLTMKKPQGGFISFLDRRWYDNKIETMSDEWAIQTGDESIDKVYYIQARSEQNKLTVQSREFTSIVKRMLPFSSMTINDTGVKVSTRIIEKSQLNAVSVDNMWANMLSLTSVPK